MYIDNDTGIEMFKRRTVEKFCCFLPVCFDVVQSTSQVHLKLQSQLVGVRTALCKIQKACNSPKLFLYVPHFFVTTVDIFLRIINGHVFLFARKLFCVS